jgi:hypothetical protein
VLVGRELDEAYAAAVKSRVLRSPGALRLYVLLAALLSHLLYVRTANGDVFAVGRVQCVRGKGLDSSAILFKPR